MQCIYVCVWACIGIDHLSKITYMAFAIVYDWNVYHIQYINKSKHTFQLYTYIYAGYIHIYICTYMYIIRELHTHIQATIFIFC